MQAQPFQNKVDDPVASPSAEQVLQGGLSEGGVRGQLARILASRDFQATQRVRRFLAYVVEETLAGRSDRIKGYAIAVSVFGRPADFDIHNDPVVRIEAGSLRRALERYYLLSGVADAIFIEMRKGGYVPSFSQRSPAKEPDPALRPDAPKSASPKRGPPRLATAVLAGGIAAMAALSATVDLWGEEEIKPSPIPAQPPSLGIRPFRIISEDSRAASMGAALSEELLVKATARGDIVVFQENFRSAHDVAPGSRHFVLEGAVRMNRDKIRVTAYLLNGATAAVAWSAAYDADFPTDGARELGDDIPDLIAKGVAAHLKVELRATPSPANPQKR